MKYNFYKIKSHTNILHAIEYTVKRIVSNLILYNTSVIINVLYTIKYNTR
nr:MAG TPA: hypothetical protein [Caudoviricetes sp.]